MELPPNDQLLASAIRFLIDGHEEDAANVLLSCTLQLSYSYTWTSCGESNDYYIADLAGPRAAYDILKDNENPITKAIERTLDAVLPAGNITDHIRARTILVSIDPDWHKELLEIARGKGVHNQLADAKASQIWNNLRFRSVAELRIAQALDRAGVFFLPNCKGRLGPAEKRENKEPDFLICYEGKWGILEVDGEPFHPPSRTVHDHERDRLFRQQGIRIVEHFDANRCYEHPQEVVRDFLNLLKN